MASVISDSTNLSDGFTDTQRLVLDDLRSQLNTFSKASQDVLEKSLVRPNIQELTKHFATNPPRTKTAQALVDRFSTAFKTRKKKSSSTTSGSAVPKQSSKGGGAGKSKVLELGMVIQRLIDYENAQIK
jgi:hypothetical protein